MHRESSFKITEMRVLIGLNYGFLRAFPAKTFSAELKMNN